MKQIYKTPIVLFCIFLCSVGVAQNLAELADMAQEHIRGRIEAAGIPPKIDIGGEQIYASDILPQFYEDRIYMPAWVGTEDLLDQARELGRIIREADKEGLTPTDYHLIMLEATVQDLRANLAQGTPLDPARVADLDILLTDAFLLYGAHLVAGRVDPLTINPEWNAQQQETDLARILEDGLRNKNIREALENLLPHYPVYARVREQRAFYQKLADEGGWPQIPGGPALRNGDEDERIPLIRKRLNMVGDLEPDKASGTLFDDDVDRALRRFQERHGLTVDGVLGKGTLAAMNVSAEQRVRQLEVNMERWRWLPYEEANRFIVVNAGGYELFVIENDRIWATIRSIVGKPYRSTPVFSDNMKYLVLNPYWFVPHSIATKDILPKVKKNSNYLKQRNFKVFSGWGANAKEINPANINWSQVTAQNFKYSLRQEPGPNNALGRIKFMFPNK
ncbi:L,D-transpeptidase family protein, partial [candidate division WOR-3 bacterium]|nr:L,D-transpeptidase family protein [candidate division WOR-3 bacterium]